jgi:hypothetical protein
MVINSRISAEFPTSHILLNECDPLMTENEKGVIVSVIEADARNNNEKEASEKIGIRMTAWLWDVEVQVYRLIGTSDTHS